MAKTTGKNSTKTEKVARKASTSVRKPKPSGAAANIETASEEALAKLRALHIEEQLQNDIEWCLGSYRADRNPAGLYDMLGRAVKVFQGEKEKKTKGVTAKLISDLEKTLKSR
ncbi:MAG: hypothetical protein ACOYXT_11475 [Bacteroidota bacterium]